jgi:hypothetical protein
LIVCRFWQISLQKSFGVANENYLKPLMRFARGGDHIASSKSITDLPQWR